jgi:chromosome segregation protein
MTNLRLKSLELNGYKTFASRTLFEFAGSVTAVVGPNGSGKSNIADSLRWVLGEQSYGVLRGRKTEDMIFAGSEKRPRSGMASVTITFDNSDAWLPIDFSEVSVTRRAYRDGQNEYLINQQKVRLKDVSELLSQSALAERTYTIIGQGLVDTALTLKSDERRRLFEEAAGIGIYRARKDQSLRRLETTLRNLERAEDILAELKPRVRSLEKQAERAEEFARLRSDLRATLREWYGYHWNRFQADLGDLRQQAVAREQDLNAARQKQASLTGELSHLRTKVQDLRAQIAGWQRQMSELNSGREGASKALAVADERKRALEERQLALKDERNRLEGEIKTQTARLEEANQDAERYEVEVQEAQAKLDEATAALKTRQATQRDIDGKTQDLRDRVTAVERRMAQAVAQREQLLARLERGKAEMVELERTLAGMQSDGGEIETLVTQAQTDLVQAEKALAQAEQAKQRADQSLKSGRARVTELEQRKNQLQVLQAGLQAEVKGIEEAEATAAGFAAGARLLLKAAEERRLSLGKGTLGQELRVPAQYEAAISAALGAYLDAVIVEGTDAEDALNELEKQQVNATLLPLGSLVREGRLQPQVTVGLVGVAADLVEAASGMRPAVELLLGRVLVAEHRQAARALLRDNPQASQVVTLRGEVFHRAGNIEVRVAKPSGGLARPREERELHAKLHATSTELARTERDLAEAVVALAAVEENDAKAVTDIETSRVAVEAARRHVQERSLESEQLSRQSDWFSAQQRTLNAEITSAEAQLETLTAEDRSLAEQLATSRQALEQHMSSAVEVPMDEQHAQVAHWEMRLAVGQRALQEAQRRVIERQQALERIQAQQGAQQERQSELEAQLQAIEAEKIHLGKQEGTVSVEITAIQAQMAPAEAELATADAELNLEQAGETQAMQAVSAAERNHTQAQIALGRQQESLESLRARIEDDFGLVAFQYDAGVSGPTPLPLGDLVEQLPVVELIAPDLEETLKIQRSQIRRLGSVNPEAQQEYAQVKERVQSMEEQVHDLRAAEVDLRKVIEELDVLMEKEFRVTFDRVANEFKDIFSRLFNGGSAKLLLTEEADMATTGIDIEARLPGKRAQRLALLSGGERSLTATALVFSLLKASPTPFCVMDEVDAMLDEANVGRFTELLRELSKTTQFVVITHNRNTVQVADVIYGITMGRDTASQVISLKLDEVGEKYTA